LADVTIHFGAWQTVYGWFRELARRFLFQTIHDIELMLDRERQGREQSPNAAVIDSQSVKAPASEEHGFDAAKKIVGRKRHIAVYTDGRLLMVNLTPADISDSAGAQTILDGIRKRWPWVKHLFADGAADRLTWGYFPNGSSFSVSPTRNLNRQDFPLASPNSRTSSSGTRRTAAWAASIARSMS
jgi:transposase